MLAPKPYIIPIFIPQLGCPHQCVYCHQSTITGVKPYLDLKRIKKQIDFFLFRKRHPKRKDVQIAFYGGSFTALNPKWRNKLLTLAFQYVQTGQVHSIRLSTRPDAINKIVLSELKTYGVKTIELGVQSFDNKVLDICQRGHDIEAVYKATELIKAWGFQLGWQLMPGLPGESAESRKNTIDGVIKWQPHFVRIYPTLVLKNTVLAKWWEEKKYFPLSLTEAVEICKEMVLIFQKANIPVIRLGLQASESLMQPGHILAGPWHPAFGEWVKSAIILEKLRSIFKDYFSKAKIINIFVHPTKISQVIGHKRRNYQKLKAYFPQKRIAIFCDLGLKREEIKITTLGEKPICLGW